jgi:adenylate kinase
MAACHLSTGDVFRAAKNFSESERSPAIQVALDCMKQGELISDETVLTLVKDRTPCLCCGGGFLLDGFPRTVPQAKALERILKEHGIQLDAVVDYRLPLKKIIARLSGRRTCTNCKAVYHIESLPPKVDGICDHCSGQLFQREDDRPEAIRVRMAVYTKNAAPLKRFYKRRNLLVSVEAAGTPQETFQRTLDAMKNRQPGRPEPKSTCA